MFYIAGIVKIITFENIIGSQNMGEGAIGRSAPPPLAVTPYFDSVAIVINILFIP